MKRKSGLLSKQERNDMAKFLLSISYPPAQKRAYTNVLSDKAEEGFELFHIKVTTTPADKDQTFAVTATECLSG